MVNKVTLIGRVGREAEIKTLDSGTKVASSSLATSESYKDSNGEWKENTEWHNITAWGKLAERLENIQKGTILYLEGKIKTDSYEKDGEKRYSTKIVANYFRTVTKAGQSSEQTHGNQANAQRENTAQAESSIDDDLPF